MRAHRTRPPCAWLCPEVVVHLGKTTTSLANAAVTTKHLFHFLSIIGMVRCWETSRRCAMAGAHETRSRGRNRGANGCGISSRVLAVASDFERSVCAWLPAYGFWHPRGGGGAFFMGRLPCMFRIPVHVENYFLDNFTAEKAPITNAFTPFHPPFPRYRTRNLQQATLITSLPCRSGVLGCEHRSMTAARTPDFSG